MREFLTRKIGPAPVWLWFVVFVIGVVVFLRWRAGKSGGSGSDSLSSNAATSPNLTTAPSTLLPFSNQTFVNVTKQPPRSTTPIQHNPMPTGPVPSSPVDLLRTVVVKAGQNVNEWVNGLGVSYDVLDKLNPTAWGVAGAPVGIQGNTNSHTDHSLDTFLKDATYLVPGAAPRTTSVTYPSTTTEPSTSGAVGGQYGYNGRIWRANSAGTAIGVPT